MSGSKRRGEAVGKERRSEDVNKMSDENNRETKNDSFPIGNETTVPCANEVVLNQGECYGDKLHDFVDYGGCREEMFFRESQRAGKKVIRWKSLESKRHRERMEMDTSNPKILATASTNTHELDEPLLHLCRLEEH